MTAKAVPDKNKKRAVMSKKSKFMAAFADKYGNKTPDTKAAGKPPKKPTKK